MSRIVLASGSPRRQELLNRIGITDFDIRVPQTDEHYPTGLTPAQIVEYISREKADAAAKLCTPEEIVITADTMVFLDDKKLGKPADEAEARRGIADYLDRVQALADWGGFDVLGHLTLPLRYMNENHGMHMSFDGFEDEVAQVFRALIENGCGIECNVNRGNTPLPDQKWLRLYHELGGEIITIGTDAHTPEFVGMRARETQELLKNCGLDYVCTFEKKKPVFHKI